MPPDDPHRPRRLARPSFGVIVVGLLIMATGCQASTSDDTSVPAFAFDAPFAAVEPAPSVTTTPSDDVFATPADPIPAPDALALAPDDDPLFGSETTLPAASSDPAEDPLFATPSEPTMTAPPGTVVPADTAAPATDVDLAAVVAAAKHTLDQDGALLSGITQAHIGSASGADLPIQVQGVVRLRDGSGELTVQGAGVPTGGPVDAAATSVDLRYNKDALLVSTGVSNGPRHWIRVERGFGTVPSILRPLGVSIGLADPLALLRGLQAAQGPVQDLGPSTSKGVAVRRVRVFVDASSIVTAPDRALERLVPFEALIDAGGLVRELHVALTHMPAAGQTEHLTIAQGFYDFGPQAAQTLPPDSAIVGEPPTTRPTTTQPPLTTTTAAVTIPGPGNTVATNQGSAATIAPPSAAALPAESARTVVPANATAAYTVPPATNPPSSGTGTGGPSTIPAL